MNPTAETILEWATVVMGVAMTTALVGGMVGLAVFLYNEWKRDR